MTFRAKPVVKRSSKPSWESRDRRNTLLNIGFVAIIVAALLLLLIAIGVGYYNDNLVSVASVGGQQISKAEWRDRAVIEAWRQDEAARRIRTQVVAGRMTPAQADVQEQVIEQQKQQIEGIALERLIDTKLQAGLATQEGITVTDADVDAKLIEEATTQEQRRVWLIEVEPTLEAGEIEPSPAAVDAARAKAEDALSDLRGGTPWDEVAKAVSTDTSTAPQAGDLGWLNADDSQADEAFLTAVFAAAVDSPTEVVEGEDGIFRIGRVSEIAPESVDEAYQAKLENDLIDLAKYRTVVRGDVIRQRLEDKVVADATKEGPQREAQEIYIAESDPAAPPTSVKVRHILYSPKDDPQGASDGTIAADDPAWEEAKTTAEAALARLQADPSLFDSVARTESDEQPARGVTGTGGKLPGYITEDSGLVQEFLDAVLAPDLREGQLIGPIKTDFGYHLIQVMYHPTDKDRMDALKADADGGDDFAALARDNSEAETAGAGGDLGWVARGQLGDQLEAAIFEAAIGGTSPVVTVAGDGTYLFKVLGEETRTPEGRQLEQIRSTAFSDWYQLKKDAVEITRDEAISTSAE